MNTLVPKISFWAVLIHNFKTRFMRKRHAVVVEVYDKELSRLEAHGVTLSSQEAFLLLVKTGRASNMQWCKDNNFYLTLALLTITQKDIDDYPALHNLVGIAIGLGPAYDRDQLLQGLVLRKLTTFWDVMRWLRWIGMIDAEFFKTRLSHMTQDEIDQLKVLRLNEEVPGWLSQRVKGLTLSI